MTKLNYLKLKNDLKTLAQEIKELKKLKREAIKKYNKSTYTINLKNITMKKSEDLLSLYKERPYTLFEKSLDIIRKKKCAFRHKHIVYCLTRGKTLKKIEPKVRKGNECKTFLIDYYKKQYEFEDNMILEKKTINNGYGCSCCRNDYRTSNWIKEDEMKSFEEIVNYVLYEKYFQKNGDIHSKLIYEKNGEIIHGFGVYITKGNYSPFFYIGNKKFGINEYSKEEILYFESHKKEYGIDSLKSKEDFKSIHSEKKEAV